MQEISTMVWNLINIKLVRKTQKDKLNMLDSENA